METVIPVLSIAAWLGATTWTVVLALRHRDWRLSVLASFLVLLAGSQVLHLLQVSTSGSGALDPEWVALAAGILLLASLALLGRRLEIEQLFDELSTKTPYLVFRLSPDGRFTYLNETFESRGGWARDEWLGRSFAHLVHARDAQRAARLFQCVVDGAILSSEEITVVTRSGESRLGEFSIVPQIRRGRVKSILGIARDVTERRRAEERLRQMEKRYRSLFQEAPVMYVLTRLEAEEPIIEDCNENFLTTLGYRREEAVGTSLADFYTPQSRSNLLQGGGYKAALQGRFVVQERQLVTKSGEILEVLLQAVPESDPDGTTRGTRAMYVDITERKRTAQALARSEEKYRALFEDSQEIIFISTPEGRLLDINPVGVSTFGYDSKEELLEVDIGRDLYVDSAKRRQALEILAARGSVKDLELRLKRKDGAEITVLESTTAVRDADGSVVAYRGIMRDVTQQRILEQRLLQAQRLEAVGQLVGGVAHDFNNLLTAIIGNAKLGLARAAPKCAGRPYLQEIDTYGQKAAALIRQLLAFSRRQVLEPVVLELNSVIAGLEDLLHRTLGETIELVIDLDPATGTVRADPAQIEQVLINLAVNARDAMPDGGRLFLETRAETLGSDAFDGRVAVQPGPFAVISVRDTGHGMDETTRRRIFEPFFTTKGRDKGTGLGLSTVYGIVKQSDGYVWVSSRPSEGATFQIYLPQVAGQVEETRRRGRDETLVGGDETILVVEDEGGIRNLITQILDGLGYRVLTAADAGQAAEICAAQSDPVDLLLTDVVLSRGSGTDLATSLTDASPAMRVVFMSGYSKRLAYEEGGLLARHPFLSKPFTPQQLASTVRDALDRGASGSAPRENGDPPREGGAMPTEAEEG